MGGSTPDTDYRPNGGKRPIYQPPRTSGGLGRGRGPSTDDAADPPLDRSGYGDLGLGLVRQASRQGLDEDDQADMTGRGMPRQDSVPNRSEESFILFPFQRFQQ